MGNRRRTFLRGVAAVGALSLMLGSSGLRPASAQGSFTVIASGLNNPRGLAVDALGRVYVAEAGSGGSGPCLPASGIAGPQCFGLTGSITRIDAAGQHRIVTGLPSLADQGTGASASGPADVTLNNEGGFDVVIQGAGGGASDRAFFGSPGYLFGHVIDYSMANFGRDVADLIQFETVNDPDHQGVDSDPYSLVQDGSGFAVADAAGNDLVQAYSSHNVGLLAVFPNISVNLPYFLCPGYFRGFGQVSSPVRSYGGVSAGCPGTVQAVPTTVTRGPGGAFYVGELTGFPFVQGVASIYRVVPGQAPQVFANGFTNIISIKFGPDGSLYVLELSQQGLLVDNGNGAIIKISPNGTRTTIVSSGLSNPTGLAVGRDGTLYVSNNGTSAGTGQVLRISQ